MFPIGFTIAVYRRLRGLSASVVAKELGVSRGFLSILELGLRTPPVSLDFTKATAKFLGVSESTVLTSIACEHFLASIKNLTWLTPLLEQAITIGFRRYYLHEEIIGEREDNLAVKVLCPADHFRIPIIGQLLSDYLRPIACEAVEMICSKSESNNEKLDFPRAVAVLKNIKPPLYKSEVLFPLHKAIVFLDSFGVYGESFSLSFHVPDYDSLDKSSYRDVTIWISPFDKDPISFFELPMPTVRRNGKSK